MSIEAELNESVDESGLDQAFAEEVQGMDNEPATESESEDQGSQEDSQQGQDTEEEIAAEAEESDTDDVSQDDEEGDDTADPDGEDSGEPEATVLAEEDLGETLILPDGRTVTLQEMVQALDTQFDPEQIDAYEQATAQLIQSEAALKQQMGPVLDNIDVPHLAMAEMLKRWQTNGVARFSPEFENNLAALLQQEIAAGNYDGAGAERSALESRHQAELERVKGENIKMQTYNAAKSEMEGLIKLHGVDISKHQQAIMQEAMKILPTTANDTGIVTAAFNNLVKAGKIKVHKQASKTPSKIANIQRKRAAKSLPRQQKTNAPESIADVEERLGAELGL